MKPRGVIQEETPDHQRQVFKKALAGITLPNPYFQTGPLSEELLHVDGYKNLQTYFPTLTKLFRMGRWNSGDEIWMDTKWRLRAIDCSGTTGPCSATLVSNKDSSVTPIATPAFLKVTHLLNPISWIQGKYSLPKESGLPWFHKSWQNAWQKLQDPWNQAYVEAIAAYALGRLREEDLSPHFNHFYGAFCARANTYRYNLSEDFQSYRHERWFWNGKQKGLFKIQVLNTENPAEPIPEDILQEILEQPDEYSDSADTESTLEELDINIDDKSVGLKSADSMSDVSYASSNRGAEADTDNKTDTNEEDDNSDDGIGVYAEIPNYPVMLIVSEKNNGTMDSLFERHEEVGAIPGSVEWELRWAAWIFQVVTALSCAQTVLGFTHNDLHTNNVVWSSTDKEFLYYSSRDGGSVFKIPTFGKVFRIIDYGRAIFTINGKIFISDDFKSGNDADGQYRFSPLNQRVEKEIPPNPSFDLCRLAVSLLDGVFPTKPAKKEDWKTILSDEPGLTVEETESPLFNMLWRWMVDDEGRNIFINPDGSERFPDFDLYKHIAAHIFKAVPSQQFHDPAFDSFQIKRSDVPESERIYSLFC